MTSENRAVNADGGYKNFSKAFKNVPSGRLIQKIKACVINRDLLGWIQNWLGHNRQRVVVEEYFSDWVPLTSDVLQGSIFEPLLFLIIY